MRAGKKKLYWRRLNMGHEEGAGKNPTLAPPTPIPFPSGLRVFLNRGMMYLTYLLYLHDENIRENFKKPVNTKIDVISARS